MLYYRSLACAREFHVIFSAPDCTVQAGFPPSRFPGNTSRLARTTGAARPAAGIPISGALGENILIEESMASTLLGAH
ncbi:MAG: hypothetical protein ACI83P_002454 [Janthinobacterium sp.]|jgi:hypothetical protein